MRKIIYLQYKDITIYDRQDPITCDFPVHIFDVVGFLVKEDKDTIWLSREIVTNQNDDVRGLIAIPKACILKRKEVK